MKIDRIFELKMQWRKLWDNYINYIFNLNYLKLKIRRFFLFKIEEYSGFIKNSYKSWYAYIIKNRI